MKTITAEALREYLENKVNHSAWSRGVNEYAIELLDNLEPGTEYNITELEKAMLNGASDWNQYSYGGCSLIYDGDIAERLLCQSELKKTRNGKRKPNSHETWLDVQERALFQAFNLCAKAIKN